MAWTRSRALVAGASLGLFLVACQGPDEYFRGAEGGGAAGSTVSGAAGVTGSGTAGNGAPGTAGNGGPGTGGSLSPTGTAGSAAGGGGGATTGAAGTTGMAGRGGTTGAAGSIGRGGTTGTAGATGTGSGGTTGTGGMGRGGTTGTGGMGRGGSTGTAGRGGTTGTAGASGRGGRGGSTGTAGATGAGGGSCPVSAKLDCTAAGSLDLSPDGQVVDFSATQWNATTATWCDADGLGGGIYEFAGTGSTAMAAVDTTARNLKLTLTVSAGQYAGGGIMFHSCVDARTFNSVQFTASVTAGSLNGCALQVQLATQDQYPTTATNPSGGTCAGAATNCKRYPAAMLATAPTATATMFTERFTAFNNPAGSTVPAASQVVGLQWQANSNNGTGTCMVELRIDNAKFVTQ